jgi:hypothetical protein
LGRRQFDTYPEKFGVIFNIDSNVSTQLSGTRIAFHKKDHIRVVSAVQLCVTAAEERFPAGEVTQMASNATCSIHFSSLWFHRD